MASIRRTLSPVPRPGSFPNGEACQVASPLSKSSSNSQNYPPPQSSILAYPLGALDYALYKVQHFILGLFSHRASRAFDRSKVKGQVWRRAFVHFLLCFIVGVFVGLTPFFSPNSTPNVMSERQAFDFEVIQTVEDSNIYSGLRNDTSIVGNFSLNENSTSETHRENAEVKVLAVSNISLDQNSSHSFHKLLIIVTPIYGRPFQTFYLNRLAQTLKLVPPPLLWIVVEMNSQSFETAEFLRNTGIMYRHLICSLKNSTGIRSSLMRNVALSHIETHRLDGIVYFADDDSIYSADLFNQMRQISRFGAWAVAKLVESNGKLLFEGPVCNGSQVIGWHMVDMENRFRRFHADMAGFAFNSTIIWDPKRWHRTILEPIRQLETVRPGFQASTFIEQVVEDESQMECYSMNSSGLLVWHYTVDPNPDLQSLFASNNLGALDPLS